MKYKKIMFMLVLAVFLLSITCVSASEIDDTLASEDTNTIGLSVYKDIIEDNLQTSEENEALASTDYDEAIAQTDTEVLGEGSAKYSDLAEEIGHSGDINLIHKNYTYDKGETITISEDNKVIDGNGAVIDMNGSTIRAFHVTASSVTIKNLTIINANYDGDGGAIYFSSSATSGTVSNCNFVDNTANYDGGAIRFGDSGTVTNCNFTGNSANKSGGAVYFNGNGEVTNCNFTDNTAYRGGAVYFFNTGSVSNCNFTDNTASSQGGAIRFRGSGTVTNCNFTNNTASGDGGAVYFWNQGTVTNCNFTNNTATDGGAIYYSDGTTGEAINCNFKDNLATSSGGALVFLGTGTVTGCNFINNAGNSGSGGAIYFIKGTMSDCNFTNNKAIYGGAVYIYSAGNVANCNFVDNKAAGDYSYGGAVYFNETGTVSNCNFTNNKAAGYYSYGGAIFFVNTATVTNCNFVDNTATYNGGAIRFSGSGNVTNCNFTGNTASRDGGAIRFSGSGNVTNCNFTNNTASGDGGAVYFENSGNVTNCNFTNNTADYAGAVYFQSTGTVANCNFVDNKAAGYYSFGGAIYIYSGTVANCNFVDNKATGEYSEGGAINMDSGTVSNCNFVDNKATGDNSYGGAVFFYDEGTVSNCNFADNSASQGGAIYSNQQYTTADTCIFKRNSDDNVNTVIYPPTLNVNNFTTVYGSGEKLTFDLKTNSSIPVTNGNISISVYFKDNGEWVRNYTCLSGEGWIPDLPVGSYIAFFDTEYAEFQKINRTITITAPEHTFWFLNYTINGNDNPVIELSHDFYFDPAYDAAFVNGIVINRPVTIKGNGNAIDAKRQARIFHVQSANAVLENLTLKNAHSNSECGAVYFRGTGSVTNCNFINNKATGTDSRGGAVFFNREGTVTNCNFVDNKAAGDYSYGGAVYFSITGTVTNCNFTGNTATRDGGAVYFNGKGDVTNCNFTKNSASSKGGAVYFSSTYFGSVTNCNFTGNTATGDGGAVLIYSGTVSNCNFTNNSASGDGGAVCTYFGSVTNCNFVNNTASGDGGAVYFVDQGTVLNCNFTNNTARYGGAVEFENSGNVTNCNFTNNSASGDGGAVEFENSGNVTNCNFTNNTATSQGGAIRFSLSGTVTNCNFTDNTAYRGGAVYFVNNGNVSNCNFINNKATGTDSRGGAVFFNREGTVSNCNFTDNTATYDGGAVFFNSNGEVTNCNFTNNKATGDGGAVYFNDDGEVTNCNFTKNSASSRGGAVYFSDTGNVTNCNFVNNTADYGGSVYFLNNVEVTNCNFVDNKATGGYGYGGAIYIYSGTVTNCNFTDNTAIFGGSVYFVNDGEVTNCNFTGNSAYRAGAVYFLNTGNVTNCNFTGNTANDGGAVFFENSGTVINCNFTNNTATYDGGAVYFYQGTGSVTNCNFAGNKATGNYGGGAIYIHSGTVTNCNFTGNNATTGSAIYFYKWHSSDTLTVSNSTFLNNRANAESLDVVKNDNTITITFTGRNNLLNAIYSRYDAEVTFTNVTYWGAKGITTVSARLSGSNKAAGQNITVKGVVNGKIIDKINGTDENGEIVLDDAGDYWIIVSHKGDLYYTEIAETLFTNMKLYANVTSLTTNNKTVNITAKSNIFSEVMPGKLLFILPNGTQINATYGTNGTWWAEHTFDAYGEYKINATYVGLDNVTINNGTITINKVNSTITLDNIVLDYGETKNVTVTTTGATGITAKIDGNNVTVINNYTIQIPVLDAGTYNLTVTTIPDDDHNPVTKEVNITVNKVNSTLTLDDVVLDYGESKSITVTTEGATGITAKIDGVDVTVSNYTIPISGLSAGNYTLTVTTIADKNHNPVTKEANINVNKVESTLTVGDIVFDYGSEGSGDVYFTGASEVTANVVNQPSAVVSVSGNKISVSGLAAGTYTLNVTTVPDENHTAVTETATITVNKVNSTLTLDDVVLDYGETKNITVTTGGATGITAKIDGVNVTVNGYTIPISGLGAGNYTLSVTTIPDDNHNPVNVTSKITVNKVESTLTVGDIVFDYDGEGSGDVSFTGASKVTANVINQPKAVVSVNDNKITVSGLAAGTYTLNVTTVPDENHTAVTETAGITVNKINSTLTLDDVELDYGDSKNVTVATEGATGITAKIDGVNVTVNGYTIPISGLGAGNYTLTVTTIPDDNHNPVNVTSKITVNKVESTLTVGDIVFDYDGEGSGDVSFTGASEVLANVVNQPSAVISVNDNKITVSGLGAGTYTLNVTNVPDENHTAVTETATITVNKINSTLTLDDVELDYGDSKNVTVATEGATGITAKIDGVNVTVNGYTIPISGLGAGNYTLTVTTIADKNHNPVTKEANITVNKVNATLTVNDVVLDYGESKNITVTTEGATGITAKIDGANVTVNGYTIPISGLGAGNYTLTVTTIADKNHNPVTKEVNITVNKLSTEIILANETLDLKVGDEVPVLANLTPAGAGNLTFTSSNEDLVFVEDNVTIVANSQGQAIITVSFAGNENYTAAENKTITVNVALNDASVSVENDTLNLKVDETSAINATINPDTIMLKIKYTSSNESVAIVDKNGIVTAVGEGRAIITIEVGDDEIYAKISTTVTVTVNKINTTADVSIPENITVGDNSTVNVVLPADAKGNVTVKVDDEVVDTVPVKDGNADVTIPSMSAGNHTVEIAYSGDGKYNPVNETKEISVSKNDITPEITIPSDIEFGDNATVDIKLPDDSTGNVTLTVDGKEINTVPVTNGTASVKLPALDAGNHTAEIAYSGDDKYKSASKTTTISIDKDSTKITAADVTATYKVDKYLVITLKDSKGNPLANASVTVDLNTIKNYTTDENGQIKIKVSNLVPKTYNAKITFAGNNNYLGSDATAKVVVKKATPKITASNKMFKTTTKNKKYTITLKDNTGKPIKNAKVYLKVNGKTYKATTNSKGKATFKITKLSKTGTFKATVTYKGNKYFNKASKKVTVKVISTWKTISKGSKAKSTVKEIQRALKNNGYYLTAYGHYLKVDGIYWDYTVKAVKQFQKAKGLKVTGKVDEKTAKKLGII